MSVLDQDLYAFTMGQLIWRRHRDVSVRYELRNRSFQVPLAARLDLAELAEHLEGRRAERLTTEEATYLVSLGFDGAYVTWLRDGHRLPEVELRDVEGHLVAEYEAGWADGVFWETSLLSSITELYDARVRGGGDLAEGRRRLEAKIRYLQEHPGLRIMEFGTRRRATRAWQEEVVARMAEALGPQLTGTSNVDLARRLGLHPAGTLAHQLSMVLSALHDDVVAGQRQVLDEWEEAYAEAQPAWLVLLPDTYGTELFLDHVADAERLRRWAGVRQDSGDALAVGERIVGAWERAGVDPAEKVLVFSDALDLRRMSVLHDAFGTRARVVFGWGTNLTNDLGVDPLSLVVKPSAADGRPCVKLSDDRAKATGPAAAVAATLRQLVERGLPLPPGPKPR